MDTTERRWFLLLAAIVLVTAWNSYDFYQLDEHFQVIEFGGSKLGIVPVQNLPWEYEAGIRSWLQPVLFAGLCKVLQFVGIGDRFLWTFAFRLFCAAWGFYALLCVYRTGAAWLPEDGRLRRNHLMLCATLGFLPFLLVRTSSENMSTSFFIIGLTLLLKNYYRSDSNPEISPRLCLVAGLMMGLAFLFRYHIIMMVGGLGLWLIFIAKTRCKNIFALASGFLIIFGLGLLIDRYGYGKWVFAFYNCFKSNLVEGKAAEFGTDPFFAYLYLILANVFAPIILILLAAMIVFWIKNPKHALTWTTLPFFIIHCFIGHKEDRYLLPLILMIIIMFHLVFLENGRLCLPNFLQKKFWHGTYKWLWRYNWFWLALLCVFPFNIDFYINHQKFIYDHRSSIGTYYTVDFDPYQRKELTFSFYRPDGLRMTEAGSLSAMAAVVRNNPSQDIYFFSKMPYLDNWPEDLARRTVVINASHFFFRWPWFVKKTTPILKYICDRIEDAECPTLFKIAPQGKK